MHYELTDELSGATSSMVRKFIPTCCINLSLSSRLSHKLDGIATKLRDLEKKKVALGLIYKDEKPKNLNRGKETSLLDAATIVGRDSDKKKLLCKLLRDEPCDKKFSVVPIVGLGGVGKTTLARLVYNETQVNDHFELMAWICVSGEFDIFKISKSIFHSVAMKNNEFEDLDKKNNELEDLDKNNNELEDLNKVQLALVEKLKGKRFLLVLDDVWSESYDDWENLVKPFHSSAFGSKIIMTTRKAELLKMLGFDHLNHLGCLPHDDAMSLLSQHALGVDNFDSHSTLRTQGEGIVKKCGGLPLALRALGRLLRTKTDVEDWDDVLNSEIWDLGKVDTIVPALRLSYHDLPSCLKQLFAYCSLFPKDFLFDKDELVLLWMAEGFLSQSTGSKSPERLGHEYFEKLLSRSFFLHAPNEESMFVMHNLMSDLASFVAEDFYVRFDNHMEIEKKCLAKYRHLSFSDQEFVGYQNFKQFESAKKLRTFLSVRLKRSQGYISISNKILVDLLFELPLLRVICLSDFLISELPESIGSLKHLRYLNLSYTQIEDLPENVGNLYNLQTLILFGCHKLSKLPKSLLRLKNLRHVDLTDTPLLKNFPLETGEMKSLQTVTKIIIGGDDGHAITQLTGLKNLYGKISIKGLDKVQNAMHARDANLSLERITELDIEWGDVFDGSRNITLEKEVLNELKPQCDRLKNLQISSYGGIKFPNWVGDPSFLWLVRVSIRDCVRCMSLPPLGQLPLLKMLFIQGMNRVNVIGSEFLGTADVAFPSLEILSFQFMDRWEVWSTKHGVAKVVFPKLQQLWLTGCSNLIEVSLREILSLRVLKINGCRDGVLRTLVRECSFITKLKIEKISGLTDEVWRGVIEYLEEVVTLKIERCNEIRYVCQSEADASTVLLNLRKLKVLSCKKLVSLGEKEAEDNCGRNLLLKSLRILNIWFCDAMVRCSCPSSIEELGITSCSSITSVSFETASGGGKKLKSLYINGCTKLTEEVFGGGENMLEYVNISGWTNLKSITELSNFIHLTNLAIKDCESLEAFPDREMLNLTSLKHLDIVNCPRMDSSFPRGHWPPNLCSLSIGGLTNPITDWGPQNFPASLINLKLSGRGLHVTNFTQLADILPSSLTSLGIYNFAKLESLSVGLQHLTSLQDLSICNCRKMKHLPKKILPSLLRLKIYQCPKLEERTSGRGSYYWPLISHIPRIM